MRNWNIIGYRRLWYIISGTLLILSAVAFGLWGLKLGLDFTGGSLMELRFTNNRPSIVEVSAAIPKEIGQVNITPIGEKGVSLRLKSLTPEEHATILKALRDSFIKGETDNFSEDQYTTVGPTIGAELRQKAVYAIIIVLTAIVLYIAWAFRKVSRPVPSWQFGLAAIVALFHDVFIPVGIFAVLGKFFGIEIDVLFITALLTVLGFSVHDTIVVFDRIREHLLKSNEHFSIVVNQSVNETMARSINTSLTTLLVLVTTLVFGGESIRYFILTLIVGIVFGTYSSIFIASPLLVSWHTWRQKRSSR